MTTEPETIEAVPEWKDRVGPIAYEDLTNGPALGAVVAAGIGAFVLGLLTTLAEASAAIKTWLQFSAPVGPLSGKVTIAVAAWAAGWAVLAISWRKRNVDFRRTVTVSCVLLALGFLGTFPAFFQRFA